MWARIRASAPRVALLAFLSGCSSNAGVSSGAKSDSAAVEMKSEGNAASPELIARGEELFNANCARCHGPRGTGTQQGPPLVHIIYEPNHHGDAAFQRAAANGVTAHHWTFGDMPPVAGVTPEQVDAIVAYVRALQREAGIGE